ncbi:MAG: hypothetical protein R2724_16545 [Bryobacterales bacterium]
MTAGLDEPGYAVSEITDDGYLRLHRMAEPPPSYQFGSRGRGRQDRATDATHCPA